MTEFNTAFLETRRVERTEDADRILGLVWNRISRALPPLPIIGSLSFTERTAAERLRGFQPAAWGLAGLLECYGKPPLRENRG
jgi:hypothetical protein